MNARGCLLTLLIMLLPAGVYSQTSAVPFRQLEGRQ